MKKSLLLFAASLFVTLCSYAADVFKLDGMGCLYPKNNDIAYSPAGEFKIKYNSYLSTKGGKSTYMMFESEEPAPHYVIFDNTGYITYNVSERSTNPYFVVNIDYPTKDEYAVFHAYYRNDGVDITELVFINKYTKEIREIIEWGDYDKHGYTAILNMFTHLISIGKFNLRDFDDLPKAYFSNKGLSFKAPSTSTYASSGSTSSGSSTTSSGSSTTSTGSSTASSGSSTASSGRSNQKVEYISGGKRTMDYTDGVLYHSRTEYDDGRYEDCLYGGGAWVCEKYGPCQSCGGRKVCAGCGGTGGISGPYMFISCMNCHGSRVCPWCDSNGWKKTTTSSSTPPPVPLTFDDGGSSYSSSSGSSSSSSSRYGSYDCPSCYGSGKCQVCNGKQIQDNSYTSTSSVCRACNGNGRCSSCGGTGKKYGVK